MTICFDYNIYSKMMLSSFLVTMLVVMCSAHRGGRFGGRPTNLTACVDEIDNPPVVEGPNPFSEAQACIYDCLATTSRSECVGLVDPEEVQDLKIRIQQAVKDCAVSSGECTEDPSFGRRGRNKRSGRGVQMRELLEELEARDSVAADEMKSCYDSCRPSRRGRGGRSKREGRRGGHHGKGGGMCLKAFCPCEVLRSCKDEVEIEFQSDIETLQLVKQQKCTCILTGSASAEIEQFCIEEEDESSEERPCP